jgi:hypothetical protein
MNKIELLMTRKDCVVAIENNRSTSRSLFENAMKIHATMTCRLSFSY